MDAEAREWCVPGERMKGGAPHRVPLSDVALVVLERGRAMDDGSGLIFPSPLRAAGGGGIDTFLTSATWWASSGSTSLSCFGGLISERQQAGAKRSFDSPERGLTDPMSLYMVVWNHPPPAERT